MDAQGRPETVSEMFPRRWLKAEDLTKPVRVTIESVEVQEVRQRDGSQKLAPVIAFKNCFKRLIANKTQCQAIMNLLGNEQFSSWPGHSITLAAGKAHNGRDTIVVQQATNGQ